MTRSPLERWISSKILGTTWTDIGSVAASFAVSGYATSTSDSGLWDHYAKASARAAVRSTHYTLRGRCASCGANDEVKVVMKTSSLMD